MVTLTLLTRRGMLMGAGAMALAGAVGPAVAQKITLEATKRKIELTGDLYLLNESLVTQTGALKLGFDAEASRAALLAAYDDMIRHIDLLSNGEPESEMPREYSVAVQFALSDLNDRWAVYGRHVEDVAGQTAISDAALDEIIADSKEFSTHVKALVSIIYEVYGEVVFTTEELRSFTLLMHERAHVERMRESMVLAAVFPDRKDAYMAELLSKADVFVQTMDVLIRNGAMYGVAQPPSPEALAALELVEAHWGPKHDLIREIAANGRVTVEELQDFFEKSRSVSDELDIAVRAFKEAFPRV